MLARGLLPKGGRRTVSILLRAGMTEVAALSMLSRLAECTSFICRRQHLRGGTSRRQFRVRCR